MGKLLGIDLGTTNSVAAYLEGKTPQIVLTPEGSRLLPSMVAFIAKGERLVGQPAKSQMITHPLHTVFSIKRLIGRKYSEIESQRNEFPFSIVKHGDDLLRIRIDDHIFSPEEISAMILAKLKEAAEKHLHEAIDGVVITVPAYFNDSQRQATKDAGLIAGLNVERIINEPTAAALAYSLDLKKKSNIVVYDFGGGTIDISILEIQEGIIKVLATSGNTQLGGSNFDIKLTQKLVGEFKEEFKIDLANDKSALQRIREAAENAKIELSAAEECEINLPFIAESHEGPLHMLRHLQRAEFENMIRNEVEETLAICDLSIRNSGLTITDIDEILLVGGSTRIPLVQNRVRDLFNKEPNRRINPDEIVAMGAALQGGIIKGESGDILLLDVTPLSLGVKTYGGAFTRLIPANTTIPISRSQIFSTVEDNQTEVEINIYQGEREIAEDNKFLGKFILLNIKPIKRGIPRIEVTFNININGILKVTALDLSTRNQKEILVTQSGLLGATEIEKLRSEAQKYLETDQKKRETIIRKNKIMGQAYAIQKLLEIRVVTPEIKKECWNVIRTANDHIEKENLPAMEKIEKELVALEEKLSALPEREAK